MQIIIAIFLVSVETTRRVVSYTPDVLNSYLHLSLPEAGLPVADKQERNPRERHPAVHIFIP
jgi:hypothetical protein